MCNNIDKNARDKNIETITKDETLILEHEMEEWRYLNEYVNKMDTGYQQSFVIIISVFSVLASLFFGSEKIEFARIVFEERCH